MTRSHAGGKCTAACMQHHLRHAAAQGFAKGMLEVADNLERAFEVAGEDAKRVQELDVEQARKLLGSLLDGLGLTDKILLQVMHELSG